MDLSELDAKRLAPLQEQIKKAKLGLQAPISPTAEKYRCTSATHQQQKRLDDNEIQRLISSYRAGSTVYELAEQFSCHRTTVSECLKSHAVQMRLTPLSEEQVNEALTLYASGLSLIKVGRRIGANAETVRQRLRERGATMRSPHDRLKGRPEEAN